MKNFHPRFLFTQLSGVVVGFGGCFITMKLLHTKLEPIFEQSTGVPILAITIWSVSLVGSMIIAMKVWGWILVKMGLLSESEAKGYPYSKPWEQDEDDLL